MDGLRERAKAAFAIAVVAQLAGPVPARSDHPAPPRLRVEIQGRLLTVAAEDVPLGAVLRAIGEATSLEVPILDTSETYSGAISAVEFPEALNRLLGDRSYILRYNEAGDPERLVLLSGDIRESAPAKHKAAPEQTVPSADEETWITQRLTSTDRDTRIVAVRRLQRLPPDRAAALASKLLQTESDPVVRGQLAMVLGRVGDGGGAGVLTKLLDDRDLPVQVAAARALGNVASDAAAEGLGRTLLRGADPALRQAAFESLATHPQESAKNYLRIIAARSADPMTDAARRALSN